MSPRPSAGAPILTGGNPDDGGSSPTGGRPRGSWIVAGVLGLSLIAIVATLRFVSPREDESITGPMVDVPRPRVDTIAPDESFGVFLARHQVDSISGGWDYVEPLLFGHACGMVIEKWLREMSCACPLPPVAHFHEWMTSSGMLYLADHAPEVGTVFTTHATVLGRTLSSNGQSPDDGLGEQTPAALAAHHKAEIEKWWPIIKAAGIKAGQ